MVAPIVPPGLSSGPPGLTSGPPGLSGGPPLDGIEKDKRSWEQNFFKWGESNLKEELNPGPHPEPDHEYNKDWRAYFKKKFG